MSNEENLKPAKRARRPKQGNSELFSEILSAANGLSVSEKTRLVRSLAGQVGLVTVGSGELLGTNNKPKKKAGSQTLSAAQRPNPLKGTKFQLERDEALKALKQAKMAAGGAVLPSDHPAVLQYASALAAYKAEHKSLSLVGGPPPTAAAVVNQPKKRVKNQSPEPGNGQVRKISFADRIAGMAAKAISSSSSTKVDKMEEEHL